MAPGTEQAGLPGDPRFFGRAGPFTLAAVADAAGADAPPRRIMLHRVAPLGRASGQEVAYCLNGKKHLSALMETGAGAVIVHPDMADKVPDSAVAIVSSDPLAAWAKVAALFHPVPPAAPGIHPSAVVAESATVDPSAEVGPLAVIGPGAVVGPRCRIAPLAHVGEGVVLGRDVRIASHASVTHALVGDRVYIYPGARIGQDGFGFAMTPEGFLTIPQLGRVMIGDDVEIGANSCVDRGALDDTVIGDGTRIDNLVMVGHNVRIGRCCVLVAQSGIAGSTVLEDGVVLAAQAGIAGHLRIGAGSRIGGKAGVMADVPPRSDVVGAPAQPVKEFFRELATIRRLVKAENRRVQPKKDVD